MHDLSSQGPPPPWVRMLFLGDSLTTGARDPHGLSWPQYFAHCALRHGTVIIPEVAAHNGATSSDLVNTAAPTIENSEAREAFLLIGTNDAKDELALPVERYLANVSLLVHWCRVFGLREYVITIPAPSGFGSPGYTAAVVDRIRKYNEALRSSGLPRLVDCEDVRDTTDGVHLTSESAETIAERAWQSVLATRTLG